MSATVGPAEVRISLKMARDASTRPTAGGSVDGVLLLSLLRLALVDMGCVISGFLRERGQPVRLHAFTREIKIKNVPRIIRFDLYKFRTATDYCS